MRKIQMKRAAKSSVVTLVLVLTATLMLLSTPFVAPALAKNFNIADNQNIVYYSSGEGIVTVPAGALYPAGVYAVGPLAGQPYPESSATSIKIMAEDAVDGTYGAGPAIGIFMLWGAEYIPVAYFIPSADPTAPNALVNYLKVLLTGLPSNLATNTRAIIESAINVERHGNSIFVQLTVPQTIIWPTSLTTGVPATIPAFSAEFNKVGGSVHTHEVSVLTGYPGASGYSQDMDKMGFNAEGIFSTDPSSTLWHTTNQAMTDCFITMHGITLRTAP